MPLRRSSMTTGLRKRRSRPKKSRRNPAHVEGKALRFDFGEGLLEIGVVMTVDVLHLQKPSVSGGGGDRRGNWNRTGRARLPVVSGRPDYSLRGGLGGNLRGGLPPRGGPSRRGPLDGRPPPPGRCEPGPLPKRFGPPGPLPGRPPPGTGTERPGPFPRGTTFPARTIGPGRARRSGPFPRRTPFPTRAGRA